MEKEKHEKYYGLYLIVGGTLLSVYGFLAYTFGYMLHCVPDWIILYTYCLGVLFFISGICAVLSGLTLQNQDYKSSSIFALLSIICIIPTYSMNESFNVGASNIGMVDSFLFSIIAITVISMSYPFHRGMKQMTKYYKLVLSITALILMLIGIFIWPLSFEYLTWEEVRHVTRFSYRYTSVCYFALSSYILYCVLRKRKKSRKINIKKLNKP